MDELKTYVQAIGVARFARDLDITKGRVYQLLSGDEITPEMCARIEVATEGKIKRVQLRPDIFGKLFLNSKDEAI